MNHAEVERHLASYVDGDCDQGTADRIAAHLAECEECASWAAGYRFLEAGLATRPSAVDDQHPGSAELAQLAAAGDDPPPTLRESARHLLACETCAADVARARAALAEVPSAGAIAWRTALQRAVPAHSWMKFAAAAALVAVGLYFVVGALTVSQPDEISISNQSISEPRTIESRGVLVAERSALQVGADVKLRAGRMVVFGDGFSVEPTASLAVEIVGEENRR